MKWCTQCASSVRSTPLFAAWHFMARYATQSAPAGPRARAFCRPARRPHHPVSLADGGWCGACSSSARRACARRRTRSHPGILWLAMLHASMPAGPRARASCRPARRPRHPVSLADGGWRGACSSSVRRACARCRCHSLWHLPGWLSRARLLPARSPPAPPPVFGRRVRGRAWLRCAELGLDAALARYFLLLARSSSSLDAPIGSAAFHQLNSLSS